MSETTAASPAGDSAGQQATGQRDTGQQGGRVREFVQTWRPSNVTGGEPIYPLMILFGLNMVDELDREAFSVLVPNIRDHFELSIQGVLTLTSIVGFVVLFLQIPLAHIADRRSRTKIAIGGAAAWGTFGFATGLAPNVVFLGAMRTGTGLGRTVVGATHESLLADYYPPDRRPAVYAFWRAANSVGQFAGPALGGLLAFLINWRAPFIIFAVPTMILIFLAWRLQDPIRGGMERKAMDADEDTVKTEESAASFAEAWRILWQVRSLRRLWSSYPILAVPVIALGPLLQLFYEEELGLNEAQRGIIASIAEPFQLVGYLVGIPFAMRLMQRSPALVMRFIAGTYTLTILSLAVLVLLRNIYLVVAMNALLSLFRASLAPAITAAVSLVLPPRVRSLGFTIGTVFFLPGFLAQPIIGGLADEWGVGTAILATIPPLLAGVAVIATAGNFIASDINKVRTATVAMAEVRAARLKGQSKLLLVKGLDVSYDTVQVLFGVDFEVDEGEIIALLGTNGAGKSTLLKAISGIVEADAGAVVFDGADSTYAPPNELVGKGIVQVPGGKGIFPGLSVAENLKLAGWLYRRDQEYLKQATEQVLEYFPVLRDRWDQPAGNLSGGEQQMLTLGMAFVAKPRLLMIDELSLGLAPIIVEQLLKIVEAIRERGTTIILVEQSVNVALNIAQTAYFMEKGEIRFHGPTEQLLDRPDILRSVFLQGAGSVAGEVSDEKGLPGGEREKTPAKAKDAGEVELRPSQTNPGILEVSNLSKSYGGVRAVDGATFTLHEGEILGIIGPNGAGKTTVFDLVSGFVMPDGGRVLFDGTDITDMAPDVRARLGLGRSFQDARLFPALTVAETIAVALERQIKVGDPIAAVLGTSALAESEAEIRDKVDELIELMGLGAFHDKFISELSTGSRRIVDLACVMAHEPKALLFDEPSSGIAQRETEALGPLLQRIRDERGTSLLVIEHDMPLITSISDEILALDLGANVVQGTPDEVVNHPRVVASYLGTNEAVISRSGEASVRDQAAAVGIADGDQDDDVGDTGAGDSGPGADASDGADDGPRDGGGGPARTTGGSGRRRKPLTARG